MLDDTRSLKSQATSEDRPKLVSIVAFDGHDDSALLELAASVVHGLETRVAAAIVESAREREVELRPVEQFHHMNAMGVVAAVRGYSVVLGNAALFRHLRLSIESLGDWPARLQRRGEHVLLLAIDGRTAGFLGIAEADV